MNIDALLLELKERLPELEWKTASISTAFMIKSLPRGLFRQGSATSAATCIAEIKADIQALALRKNESTAYLLAKRIHQKINVLVSLCHRQIKKEKPQEKINFGVTMISTRQQWLKSLEGEILLLTEQRNAMKKTLEQKQSGDKSRLLSKPTVEQPLLRSNEQALLSLQNELGVVERRLTLAKEAFLQASGTVSVLS